MKETKKNPISTKLNDRQVDLLDRLISEGKVKTRAGAIQYLINMAIIRGE